MCPIPKIVKRFLIRKKAEKLYFKCYKKKLNWKNPQTFNEKICVYKMSSELEKYSVYTDKYEVRNYVKKTIGSKYLNKLYGVYENVDQIDLNRLPKSFVLKATHGSGWNILCTDKNNIDWPYTKGILAKWLKLNYYNSWDEIQYKNIRPRIICEKYLCNSDEQLTDYKFYCFHGHPSFIQVDKNRFIKHTYNLYDTKWHLLTCSKKKSLNKIVDKKPKNLKTMLILSEKLSSIFPHVRVDFYNINSQIIFGELTFTSGNGVTRFSNIKLDYHFGKPFKI